MCLLSNQVLSNPAVMYIAPNNANQPFVVYNQQQLVGGSQLIPGMAHRSIIRLAAIVTENNYSIKISR